jgi:nitrogen fixation protein NifB
MPVIPISSAPGFAAAAHDTAVSVGRLPVAPQAFCRMRHPQATGVPLALNPPDVVAEITRSPGLTRVELDGPGDPLASFPATLAAVALIREHWPELIIGITTLGLQGADRAGELAAVGVGRVTLLVDALDAATAERLYAWIRPGKKNIPLPEAVSLLLDEQARAVPALVAAGLVVTIRTTVYPGINAHHIPSLAETMAELGATALHLVPFLPDPGRTDAPPPATRVHMEQLAKLTSRFMPTTSLIMDVADCGCDCGPRCGSGTTCGCGAATPVQIGLPQPTIERPRVAVASETGMEVDLHLGQARTLLIYGPREDGLTCLLETRPTPDPGSGVSRWQQLADVLHDCFALLAVSAGQRPREVLGNRGIRVILTEENIEGTVDVLYGGGKKHKCKQ